MYCAADNIDFLEDTPHGKGTLHGTVMVIYQEKEPSDKTNPISIAGPSSVRSLPIISYSQLDSIPYNNTLEALEKPVNSQVVGCNEKRDEIMLSSNRNKDLLWMILQSSCIKDNKESISEEFTLIETIRDVEDPINVKEPKPCEPDVKTAEKFPCWSAFNSKQSKTKKETRVCVYCPF